MRTQQDELWKIAEHFDQRGRLAEAIGAAETVLHIERQLHGRASTGAAFVLQWMAARHEQLRNFAKATQQWRELVDVRTQLHGEGHWQTTDARLALAHAQRLAKLDRPSADRLLAADQLMRRSESLGGQRQFEQAAGLAQQVMQTRIELLGEQNAQSAAAMHWRAFLHERLGQLAQADQLYRRCLAVRRNVLGTDHPETARTLNNLGFVQLRLERYGAAEAFYKESLAIKRKCLGPDELSTANTMINLGDLYERQSRFVEAEPLYQAVAGVFQKHYGPEHVQTAGHLLRLGRLRMRMKRYREAEPPLTRALQLYKKLLGDSRPETLSVRGELAAVMQNLGRFAEAEELFRQAIEGMDKLFGQDNAVSLKLTGNSLSLLMAMGHYAKAEQLGRQSLETCRQKLGEENPITMLVLNNLAVVYEHLGDFRQALALHQRSVEIHKKMYGEQNALTATAMANLGAVYQSLGNYAKAEALFQQSLAVHRQLVGDRHPDTASGFSWLAGLHRAMGDNTKARMYYEKALRIEQDVLGKSHPRTAITLDNLGGTNEALGNYDRAAACYQQSLDIFRHTLGADHADTAVAANNLAGLYVATGKLDEAQRLFRESLEAKKRSFGPQHPDVAVALNNLGRLHERMGQPDEAADFYKRALEILEHSLGPQHPRTATVCWNLGNLAATQGRYREAAAYLRRALQIHRPLVELTSAVQSERQQLAMLSMYRGPLVDYLRLVPQGAVDVEQAYSMALAWKGIVFERQARQRVLRHDPQAARLFDQLDQVGNRLATLSQATVQPAARRPWLDQIEQLSDRWEQLQRQLAQRSSVASGQQRSSEVGVDELRQALPADVALVDMMQLQRAGSLGAGAGKTKHLQDRLLAFVVRRDEPVQAVDLGPLEPVAEAIKTWRRTFGHGSEGKQAAGQLRQSLWEPLHEALAGASTVLISPDGIVGEIPFAALPGRKENRYLIEDVRLAVVAAPRWLPQLLATSRRRQSGQQRSLLLVGNVDYDAADSGPSGGTADDAGDRSPPAALSAMAGRLAPLAGTGQEVRAVGDIFREAFPGGRQRLLEGPHATEAALKRQLEQYDYVLLATHGFFVPSEGSSALRPTDRRTTERFFGGLQDVVAYHPGLLSAIALAGANRAGARKASASAASGDGILTALELAGLDMTRTDLVVLSACQTGLGTRYLGEGTMGLARAIEVAGARTTLSSLWKVHDDATRALMAELFHNLWVKRQSKLDAFRNAQLTMLRQYDPHGEKYRGFRPAGREVPTHGTSPYFWAAFVLSGDWR